MVCMIFLLPNSNAVHLHGTVLQGGQKTPLHLRPRLTDTLQAT